MTPNDTSLLEAKNLLRRCLAHLEVLATDLESSKGLAGEVSRFLGAPPVEPMNRTGRCEHCDRRIVKQYYGVSVVWMADNGTMFCKTGEGGMTIKPHSPKPPVIPPPITADLVERVSAKMPQGGVRNREWANERARATGLAWLPWKLSPDSDPGQRYILVKAEDDEVEHPSGTIYDTEAEAWTAAQEIGAK